MNTHNCIPLLLLFATIVSSHAQTTNIQHWNVLESGAVPNGQTDCTVAFQKALDAAGKTGGGVVEVPAGKVILLLPN